MKKIIICALVVVFAAVSAHAQEFDFQKSPDFGKLDLRAKQAWLGAMRAGDKSRQLKCMLRTTTRMSPDQKNRLGSAGFKPTTIIQNIVTGQVAVNRVPSVARLDFVQVVELAVPLDYKKDPGYRKYGVPSRKKARPKAVKEKEVEEAKTPELVAPQQPVGQVQPVEVVQPEERTSDVPIYQERPPTSDEFPETEGGPAVAPVDQPVSEPVVQPEVTAPTQTPVKPEPEGVYAPSQSGQ